MTRHEKSAADPESRSAALFLIWKSAAFELDILFILMDVVQTGYVKVLAPLAVFQSKGQIKQLPVGILIVTGIGDGLIPDILNTEVYDNTCIIPDDNALDMAKRLASEEGIMCGISSGTNVVAAIMLAEKLGPGKTVVTVLPDTAERYFSTPLFE